MLGAFRAGVRRDRCSPPPAGPDLGCEPWPAGRAGSLVDDRAGDGGLAVLIAADVQAVEPGRPAASMTTLTRIPSCTGGSACHRRCGDQRMSRAMTASRMLHQRATAPMWRTGGRGGPTARWT